MSKIITGNIEQEYRRATSSVVTDINSLPDPVKKGMKRRASSGVSVDRVAQQYHNPFIQSTELEIPKDRKERNRWYRYYFATEPLVQSAIRLHTEFPLSTFDIVHEDPAIEEFFSDMVEDINLFEFILELGMEYWVTGEIFPFGFLDDVKNPQMWTDFILLHPNFVEVESDPWVRGKRKSHMWLTPTDTLTKIVTGGASDEKTGTLYQNLPSDIIKSVKEGKIELNDLQVSHIKRTGNYFNTRGTSIIDCVLKLLIYKDKLRSAQYAVADRHVCHDAQTECLTRAGWKTYDQLSMSDEIATVNKDTGNLEYQYPITLYRNYYEGELLHFTGGDDVDTKGKRVDIMVTPDHKMLVKNLSYIKGSATNGGEDKYSHWKAWEVCDAKDVRPSAKFRAVVDTWEGEQFLETVTIECEPGKIVKNPVNGQFIGEFTKKRVEIPILDYLEFLGYWISEGSLGGNTVVVYQALTSVEHQKFKSLFDRFELKFLMYLGKGNSNITTWGISDRGLVKHLVDTYGSYAYNKKLSTWVKNLPRECLQVLLDALVAGDGHEVNEATYTTREGENKTYDHVYREYYTTSKQLADDVQEIVFKLGYAPRVKVYEDPEARYRLLYTVYWSETGDTGKYPYVGYSGKPYEKVPYEGIIWCVEVPNHIFVTRRNGKIAIQGNSPFELYAIGEPGDPADEGELEKFQQALVASWTQPNKAIIWHHAVRMQWEGASGRVLPLQPEFENIDNQIMSGLMISKAFLHGEGPCADPETEFLTETGFKKAWEVTDKERLMTFNTESQKIEFQDFKNRIVQEYEGELIHFISNNIDSMVTPNHRMYVQEPGKGWCVLPADEVQTGYNFITLEENKEKKVYPVEKIEKTPYKGKVYCFEVPNEFLVVRRNGKMLIFGNTYANASVALDVLVQRYLLFRMRIENWIERCVFGPMCKIHGLYKPTKAEIDHKVRIKGRDKKLWLPEVKWTKEHLRDNMQKINIMQQLAEKERIPWDMVLPLLNIDPKVAEKGMEEQYKKQQQVARRGLPTVPAPGAPVPPGPLPASMAPAPAAPGGALPAVPVTEEGGAVPPESHAEIGLPESPGGV